MDHWEVSCYLRAWCRCGSVVVTMMSELILSRLEIDSVYIDPISCVC